MVKRVRSHPKPKRQTTYIKAWRKKRDLTLSQLVERLELLAGLELSESQLSRIERGDQPYNQDQLEGLAVVLQCQPAHLLNVDPNAGPNPIYSLWETLNPVQRRQAARLLRAVADDDEKTGTDD